MSRTISTKNINFFGIDPGLVNTGLAVLDEDGEVISTSLIKTKPNQPLATRLSHIYEMVGQFINNQGGSDKDIYAIEDTFVAKSNKTSLLLGHGRAAAMVAFPKGAQVYELAPTMIKRVVYGKGVASKLQIQFAVQNKESEHIADAIAVAKTAYFLHKQSKLGAKNY